MTQSQVSINDLGGEDDSHQSFNSERIRTSSGCDEALERSRTGTFKHVYCDYDISQFNSTVAS